MRIGLYGMPTSGKTFILDKIDFMEVIVGSKLLRQYDPDFDLRDEEGREKDRRAVAKLMMEKDEFIMDGHYAFGDEVAFTEEEGEMYEVYLYLYVAPEVLIDRISRSEKNCGRFGKFDIEAWQKMEIENLRKYCHDHNKDFYVLDNPPKNTFDDVNSILDFIREIQKGYSCKRFAEECASEILKSCPGDTVILLDGDKTLTLEDTSGNVFGYKTHLYDGNFYTGYQAWKQSLEFKQYTIPKITKMPVLLNEKVRSALGDSSYILTSGNKQIWSFISNELCVPFFCGVEMSAETKLYITKLLQEAGKEVIAYGDGMNDYYMLIKADKGFLVTKTDGSVSRSLKGRDLGGLTLVRT